MKFVLFVFLDIFFDFIGLDSNITLNIRCMYIVDTPETAISINQSINW